MSDIDRDTALRWVKKLLALAANNSNEEQALSALRKATRYIAQFNLEEDLKKGEGTQDRIHQYWPADSLRGNWERIVWFGVAELNFCTYYYSSKPQHPLVHNLIGTKVNVISSQVLAEYLVQTINRLAYEAPIKGTDRPAFKLGCARRIQVRLMQLKKERSQGETQATEGTTLPALLNLYESHKRANNDLLSKVTGGKGLKKGKGIKVKNEAVFMKGYEAGGGISLDLQVDKDDIKSIE